MKKDKKYILLIDYGNSNLKAWVIDTQYKLITKFTTKAHGSLNDFKKKISNFNIYKSIWACSNQKSYVFKFIKMVNQFKTMKNIVLDQQYLLKFLKLNKFIQNQQIGIDILLLLIYFTSEYQNCLVISLGTVYFALVIIDKILKNVLFMPNLTIGLQNIPQITSINHKLIPNQYDKYIGLKTKDCFSAGCHHALDGWINSIKSYHSINNNDIFILGGDTIKFPQIIKKYQYEKDIFLKVMIYLLKKSKI